MYIFTVFLLKEVEIQAKKLESDPSPERIGADRRRTQ